jgi:hypothetical protein
LRGHPELSVRDLTDEEKEALREGFLSEEQLVERLTMTSKTADPKQAAYENALSTLVARVLLLRERFQNLLANLEDRARQEGVPSETTESEPARSNAALRYLEEAQRLESDCDAEMKTLVSGIRMLVHENGGDAKLPDTVMEAYQTEKELKKAWLLSCLAKDGLLDSDLSTQETFEAQPAPNADNEEGIVLPMVPLD